MRVLMTGATSFLGQKLLDALLSEGHEVALLLPPRTSVPQRSVRVYYGAAIQERLGLDAQEYAKLARWVEAIVHCPRGAHFKERFAQGLRLENLRRTEGILAFAAASRCNHLHFISSAFVSGHGQGPVYEEPATDNQGVRNQFEWFKYQAERMVLDFQQRTGLPVSIYRPSIILENPGAMGLSQAVALQFDWLIHLARVLTGGGPLPPGLRFTVAGDPAATLNIVTVDYCARAIARLVGVAPAAIYHLVNPEPPSLALVTRSVGDVFGIETEVSPALSPEVAWTANIENSHLRRLERLIYRSYRVYLPYHYDRLAFDDTHTRRALASSGITCTPIDGVQLVHFLRGCLAERLARMHALESLGA
jgi:nucleoside-diphosphate-sugar epimerase